MTVKLYLYSVLSILITTLAITGGLQAQVSHNIDLCADIEITGDWRDVVVDGEILYFANAYGLMVYRFNPDENERPVEITHIATPGIATGLCLRDTLLYLTDGYNGLLIFSISNPENPRQIGHCADLTNARYVDVADDYAYVTNVRGSLTVVSVENPESPEIVRLVEGHQRMPEIYFALADDDYLYLSSEGGDMFLLFDRSDPSDPQEISRIICSGARANGGVHVVGDLVYLPNDDETHIISISDPDNPEIVGEFGPALDIKQRGQYLYTFMGSLSIWNIEDPLNPLRITTILGTGYHGYALDLMNDFEDYVVCAAGDYGPRIVNISNPRDIFFTEDSYIYGIYAGLATQDDNLYMTNQLNLGRDFHSGIKIFSIENYLAPREIATFDFQGMCRYIDVFNNFAYLGSDYSRWDGLYVVSVEDPQNLALLGNYEMRTLGVTNIIAEESYVIAIGSGENIHIADVSDPNNPHTVEFVFPFERINDVCTDGQFVFATGYNYTQNNRQGVTVYSREEFPELEEIGTCETTVFPGLISSFGDYLYINNNASGTGLSIISIENPAEPSEVNVLDEIRVGSSCQVYDNFLIVGERYQGIRIYSLADPTQPELVGWYDTPGRAHGIDIRDDYLILGDFYTISQYDISRATGSWNLGVSLNHLDFDSVTVDTSVIGEITLTSEGRLPVEILDINIDNPVFRLVSDSSFTLEPAAEAIIRITFTPDEPLTYEATLTIDTERRDLEVRLSGCGQASGIIQGTAPFPLEFILENAYPNPFNSITIIGYQLPVSSEMSIRVFDLSGREVATLIEGTQPSGQHSINWDADAVTAGIYFVKMDCVEFSSIRKVVLVK